MMGRDCSTHGRDVECVQNLVGKNLKGEDQLENRGEDERIILE
jgi:hypothetical protein